MSILLRENHCATRTCFLPRERVGLFLSDGPPRQWRGNHQHEGFSIFMGRVGLIDRGGYGPNSRLGHTWAGLARDAKCGSFPFIWRVLLRAAIFSSSLRHHQLCSRACARAPCDPGRSIDFFLPPAGPGQSNSKVVSHYDGEINLFSRHSSTAYHRTIQLQRYLSHVSHRTIPLQRVSSTVMSPCRVDLSSTSHACSPSRSSRCSSIRMSAYGERVF
jgi:hypothetical protein